MPYGLPDLKAESDYFKLKTQEVIGVVKHM